MLRAMGDSNPEKSKGRQSSAKREKKAHGRTQAFLGAALWGDKDRLRRLAEEGVNLGTRDESGRSALHLAAGVGFSWGVKFLIEAGADVDAQDDQGRSVASHAAGASCGSEAAVRVLVAAGADLDAPNALGYTPVMLAAGHGAAGALGLLIKAGADVEARALAGRGARELAAQGVAAGGSSDWSLCVALIDEELARREAARLDGFVPRAEEGGRENGEGKSGKRRAL